jgi:ureidoacrylate peracid hydrolase
MTFSITRRGFAALAGSALASPALAESLKDAPRLPPLDKHLEPARTALVLVDFQNTFAAPGGETYPHYEKYFERTHMREKSVDLVKKARALGVQIVHVIEGYSQDYRELDWGNGADFHRAQILRQAWKSGSWSVQLYAPMIPGPDDKDIVLPNRITVNGFGNNGLDYILKSKGIRNVGFGGFSTEGCVYATMLAGYDLGYRMFAITDAMATTREELAKLMLEDRYPQYSRVMDSQTFLAMLTPAADVMKWPT